MSVQAESIRPAPHSSKEISAMSKRVALLLWAFCLLLALSPGAAASAAQPWWQVVTGSHPSNLGKAKNEIQEIDAPSGPFALSVGGSSVGFFNLPPIFPEGNAANVQTALEGDYGAGNVEVTGGPAGVAPLIVTSIGADAGKSVPAIDISPPGSAKVLQEG